MCRIALLIYSDMVMFPLPTVTGTKARLAKEIRRCFELLEPSVITGKLSHFLAWAILLGGIASMLSGSSDRGWFLNQFALSICSQYADLPGLKPILHGYIWCDFLMDEKAHCFWNEASVVGGVHPRLDGVRCDQNDILYLS